MTGKIENVDFLIIGAGIAGLSAGIKLQEYGNVVILVKRDFHDCNTYFAAGGIASSGMGFPVASAVAIGAKTPAHSPTRSGGS